MNQSQQNNQQSGPSFVAPALLNPATEKIENGLVASYGEAQRPRIQRGLKQISYFWRASDGDQQEFESFVLKNFAGDQSCAGYDVRPL